MSRKKQVVGSQPAEPKPLSQRGYATHRKSFGLPGGTLGGVQKAIRDGRLSVSLTKDSRGHTKIISAEVADREWAANTRRTSPEFGDGEKEPDANTPVEELPYAEAMRRREIENWLLARVKRRSCELDLDVKRGDLIPSAEAREVVFDAFTVVRTKMLGVPSRCRQRIPGLKPEEMQVIEDLIREALEELADGDG